MQYEVGQIIYILKNKNLQIVPAKVNEEIVRKTVDETIVQYVVGLPNDKKIMIGFLSLKYVRKRNKKVYRNC